MKAFVIADRAPQGGVRKLVAEQSIDIIITLGDLSYPDLAELKYITDIPKIGVYGNHCLGTYSRTLKLSCVRKMRQRSL